MCLPEYRGPAEVPVPFLGLPTTEQPVHRGKVNGFAHVELSHRNERKLFRHVLLTDSDCFRYHYLATKWKCAYPVAEAAVKRLRKCDNERLGFLRKFAQRHSVCYHEQ